MTTPSPCPHTEALATHLERSAALLRTLPLSREELQPLWEHAMALWHALEESPAQGPEEVKP